MKKIISLILICTFLLSTSITVMATNSGYKEVFEENVICDATIQEDFEDDSVIVVFKNTESKKLRSFTNESFSEISAKSVKDLTTGTKNKIEKQRTQKVQAKSGLSVNVVSTADEMYVDENDFHQIIKIDLGVKSKENVLACIKKLEAREDILMAFPNYYFEPTSTANVNDPYYQSQWGLGNIHVSDAWGITTGSNTVKVGVLDSGIDSSHPDLANRYNSTLSKDFTTTNSPGVDIHGHGTQIAGIIGAQTNNGVGVAGVCQKVSLVSLKVSRYNDKGQLRAVWEYVADAIDYAVEKSIPILNFSYCGVNTHNSRLGVALNNYKGLFVCSTTNEREDVTNYDFAHQNYIPSQTIVVAGTNVDDVLFTFYDKEGKLKGSSYSATKVHLAAPGDNIWTTDVGGSYICTYGTSMATPYVAGVAALLKSKYPAMSASAIKYYITNNVDDIPELEGMVSTGGRLNAYKALNNVKQFTVKYNPNGGTGTMADTTVIYNNTTALRSNQFTKSGKVFVGWHSKRAYDGKCYYTNGTTKKWYLEGQQPSGYYKYLYPNNATLSKTSAIDGDVITMYAQWDVYYTVSFNSNGGTGTMQNISAKYSVPYNLTGNAFSKTGYHFDHWYAKKANGTVYCIGPSGGQWYLTSEIPDNYSRKAFDNNEYINEYSLQNLIHGDTVTMHVHWEPNAGLLGDVDMDGTVTVTDATLVQKYLSDLVTLTTAQRYLADVDYDGDVDVQDSTKIRKYASDLIRYWEE